MPQGNIRFSIGFNVDKSGLSSLEQELSKLSQLSTLDFKAKNLTLTQDQVKNLAAQAQQLETIFKKSYNVKLGTTDFTKLEAELNKANLNVGEFLAKTTTLGPAFAKYSQQLTSSIHSTNTVLKETHMVVDKLKTTLGNTIRWSITSAMLNSITGSIQKAYNFTKSLDTSLNDIRIVTGKSAEEMEKFAQYANNASKALGATTRDYSKAALIYYQQGLAEKEVQARSNVTVKAANVTGQSTNEVSEQLTAIWNGYKVSAQEAELYIDKVSKVAAQTAADLEELSTGMSKVASAANSMGVDVDQLNAQLATIISVTRQDSSVVGTALKTIYSRMGDLAVNGEDEFGTKLGDVSSKLRAMGVDILDTNGDLRKMGVIIEEVAAKWGTWTSAQQQAAAIAMAGTRQYNNLIALFDNWNMYEAAKTTSQSSAGELQKQQEIYLDSMEAKLNNVAAAQENLYIALVDNDGIKLAIEGLSKVLELTGNVVESIGGGVPLLMTVSGIVTKLMASKFGDMWSVNRRNVRNNREASAQNAAEIKNLDNIINDANNELNSLEDNDTNKYARQRLQYTKEINELKKFRIEKRAILTEAQEKELDDTIAQSEKILAALNTEQAKQEALLKEAAAEKTRIEAERNKKLDELHKKEQEALENHYKELEKIHNGAVAKERERAKKRLKDDEESYAEESAVYEADKAEAMATFRKQVRTRQGVGHQGEAFSEGTDLSFKGSSGKYITPEDAVNRLVEFRSSFEVQNSAFAETKRATESKNFDNNKINELVSSAYNYINEHKEQLDINEDSLENFQRVYDEYTFYYQKAIEELKSGEVSEETEAKVRTTAAAVAGLGKEVVDQTKKDTNDAIKFLRDAEKRKNDLDKKEKENKKNRRKYDKDFGRDDDSKAIGKKQKEANDKIAKEQEKYRDERKEQETKLTDEIIQNAEKELQSLTETTEAKMGIVTSSIDGVAGELENLGDSSKKFKQNLVDHEAAENVANLAGGLAQMGGALTSIYNLGNIWDNDELSDWEKFASTVTTAGFALPMLYKGLQTTSKTLGPVVKSIGASIKAMFSKNAVDSTQLALQTALNWQLLIGVAALAALAVGAYALAKAYNSEADAAKLATERAEELASAYEDTKVAYEDLKNSISDYEDAKNALDELTVGTTEWKEAMLQANDEAMQLLKTYPELVKSMQRVNGVITFKEGALEEAQANAYDKMIVAQNVSLRGQQDARNAEIELQKETLQRNTANLDLGQTIWSSRSLGKVIYDISQGKNPFTEELDKDLLEQVATSIDEAILQSGTKDDFIKALETANINVDDDFKESLYENATALLDLKESIDQNNALLAQENATIYANILQQKGYSAEEAQVLSGMAATEDVLDTDREAELIKRKNFYRSKVRDGKTASDTKLILEWLNYQGFDYDVGSINQIAGGTFDYRVNGEEKRVDWDTLYEDLAKRDREEYYTSDSFIASAKQTLGEANKRLDSNTYKAFTQIIANQNEITRSSIEDYDQQTIKELESLLKVAEEIGLNTQQIKNIEDSIHNLSDYRENIQDYTNWSNQTLAAVKSVFSDDYSSTSTDDIDLVGAFLSQFNKTGLEAAQTFFQQLNSTEIIKFITAYNKKGEDETVQSVLRDVGIENKNADKFIYYTSLLNKELSITADTISSVNKVVKGLSNYGDTISADDYSLLIETYGDSIADYFAVMEDGTYILTQSAITFQHEINKLNSEKLLNTAVETLDNFSDLQNGILAVQKGIDNRVHSNNSTEANKVFDLIAGRLPGGPNLNKNTYQKVWSTEELQLSDAFKENVGLDISANFSEIYKSDIDKVIDFASSGQLAQFGIKLPEEYLGTLLNDSQQRAVYVNSIYENEAAAKYLNNVSSNTPLVTTEYFDLDEKYVRNLIETAKNAGLIDEEQRQSFIEKIKTQPGALSYSESYGNEILNELQSTITKALEDPEQRKQAEASIATAFTSASSQEELDAMYKALVPYNHLLDEANGKTLDLLKSEALNSVTVNTQLELTEQYNTALEVQQGLIEQINKELEKESKITDRLYGADKINSLKEQNELIKEQREEVHKLYRDAEKEIGRLVKGDDNPATKTEFEGIQAGLEALGLDWYRTENGSGYNITTMMNTSDGFYTYLAYLEEARLKTTSQIDAEAINDYIERLKALFEPLLKTIDENVTKYEDLAISLIDNTIAQFETELKTRLEELDLQQTFNDFYRELTEETDFLGLNNLLWEQYSIQQNKLETYTNKLNEWENKYAGKIVDNIDDVDEDTIFSGDYQEKYNELLNETIESYLEWKDIYESFVDLQLSSLDELNSKYDEQVGYYETIISLAEHQNTLNELLYGDNAQAQLKDYYTTQLQQLENVYSSNVDKVNALSDDFMAALDPNNAMNDEYRQTIIDTYIAAVDAAMTTINERAQATLDEFQNNMELAVKDFEKKLTGGQSMDWLKQDWDWTQRIDDTFLDQIESWYGIQEIGDKFNAAIANTKNVSAQQRLNKLREQELKALEEKDQLTQYDLDRAEKRLALLQAQINLENAQATKNQMRLMRGADGTYSYQYVADENQISQARQEVESLKYELYQLDKDQFADTMNEFYEVYTEYVDKMKEYWSDGQLTAQEQEDLQALQDYLDQISLLSSDIKTNLGESADYVIDAVEKEITESDLDTLIPGFSSDLAKAAVDMAVNGAQVTLQELDGTISKLGKDYLEKLQAFQSQIDALKTVRDEKTGEAISLTDALSGLSSILGSADNAESIIGQLNNTHDVLRDQAGYVETINTQWAGAKDGLKGYTENGADIPDLTDHKDAATAIADAWAKAVGKDSEGELTGSGVKGYVEAIGKIEDEAGSGGTKLSRHLAVVQAIVQGWNDAIGINKDGLRGYLAHSFEAHTSGIKDIVSAVEGVATNWIEATYWLREYNKTALQTPTGNNGTVPLPTEQGYRGTGWRGGYASGGYTGAWGPEGKLAVLHEKELVLNKADTRNILTAVDLVSKLNDSMFNSAAQIVARAELPAIKSAQVERATTIKQNVTIEAVYPNVNTRADIEDAFNDLVGLAAQHAYENKR